MLSQVSIKDIPMSNFARKRIEKKELKFSEEDNCRSDDKEKNALQGAVVIGYLTMEPIIFTLGSENKNAEDVQLLLRELEQYFEKLTFFTEGAVYKVQAHLCKDENRSLSPVANNLPQDIATCFDVRREIGNPSDRKAHRVWKDEKFGSLDETNSTNANNVTIYMEREVHHNQGHFSMPISNLTYEEVEENKYLRNLANRFDELFVIGCGETWVATHLVVCQARTIR
jgi:hypothetical protein